MEEEEADERSVVRAVERARGLGLPGHMDLRHRLTAEGPTELWEARDRRRGHDIVVKVLSGPRAARRVEAEARALARVGGHPGVLVAVAVGSVGPELAWLVTDRAAGGSLAERTAASPAELTRWAAEVADVLAHAHDLGVVHGDVTPTNVLLDHPGEDAHVVLADFGSAAVLPPTSGTPPGHTPRFAAPERRRGGPPSAESDVFGLGATITHTAERLGVDLPPAAHRALLQCGETLPSRRPRAADLSARLRR